MKNVYNKNVIKDFDSRRGRDMKLSTLEHTEKNSAVLSQLKNFYELFQSNGDQVSAMKIAELAKKIANHENIILFCGHFSAGKSSMINHFVGEDLLPSSPIPTSANLVKIKISDEHIAKVHFVNNETYVFHAPFHLDQIKKYCKDGAMIHSIDIEYPSKILPMDSIVLDTPGIDSTDDAHRISTESALHLADICFYVMDYNHVQAEQNFLFTKEYISYGKPLYLIVNMIDKHQEEEIPFSQFKNSIVQSFAQWGVVPERIFFTSLKDPHHPLNEIEELKQFIIQLFKEEKKINIEASLKQLIDGHLQYMALQQEDKVEHFEGILSDLSDEERDEIHNQFIKLTEEKNQLNKNKDRVKQEYDLELNNLLNNAYLMPAETREMAKEFLESRQKDFKVGFLFGKKKTEEVKKERLIAFQQSVQRNVDTGVVWGVKDILSKFMKELGVIDSNIEYAIQNLTLLIDENLILGSLKEGALVTGQFVLNYTKDVAESIKKFTRQKVNDLFASILEVYKKQIEPTLIQLETSLTKVESYKNAIESLQQIEEQNIALKLLMIDMLSMDETETSNLENFIKEITAKTSRKEKIVSFEDIKLTNTEKNREKKVEIERTIHVENHFNLGKLTESTQLLEMIPTYESIAQELRKKINRLKNQQFTVALFGAFSAGKSSFANALLGEKVLPSSPNPTTASICKVMPPDEKHPHETGIIKFKSPETLLMDVNEALEKFGHQAISLSEAVTLTKNVIYKTHTSKEEHSLSLSFLNAFSKGYEQLSHHLNKSLFADKEMVMQFIAEEDKSCFVEEINFYYESELTKKGITIVDTPGADSINARHTDVAFEYIKNADAILFVTYYNHAFSKADREFLIQLGRVKDQFALDKMFFIINATDLAQSEDDLHDVISYVDSELIKFGIRNANIYPVSSLNGLKEKKLNTNLQSGLKSFEHDFYHFIEHILRSVAYHTVVEEFKAIVSRVEHFIKAANQDSKQKEEMLSKLRLEKVQLKQLLENVSSEIEVGKVQQEIEELVFYVKQRVFLRFNDFFKEAFNPGTINGTSKNAKQGLETALKELLQSIGFDFAQELRATSLRVEMFMNKKLGEFEENLFLQCKKINNRLSFTKFEFLPLKTPQFENYMKSLPLTDFKKALNMFSNAKAFFEKNEKLIMAEMIQNQLQQVSDLYLTKEKQTLNETFKVAVEKLIQQILENIHLQFENQYASFESALQIPLNIEEIESKYKILKDAIFAHE